MNRFQIRIDSIWRPLLLVGGATRENSYVELTDEGIHFRFGLLFDRLIAYDDVKAVFPRSWPLLYGIGWRSNLRGVFGLIGSYHDVVEVRLSSRRLRVWGVFPTDRIGVSLEEPERFVFEVEQRTGLGQPAQHAGRGSRASSARRRTRRREDA